MIFTMVPTGPDVGVKVVIVGKSATVTVVVASVIVPCDAPERLNVKVRFCVWGQLSTGTRTTSVVTPGVKVSVPLWPW